MRHFLPFILHVLFSGILLAGITTSESANQVYYRGSNERAGGITMRVDGNDFAGISPEAPAYIRIRLLQDATLAHTLVDPNGGSSTHARPIFLAMTLDAPESNTRLVTPPDTLSVVRWVAGETDIWLRIRRDSSGWLETDGEAAAPAENATVAWTIGISARTSAERASLALSGANLPFNSLDPDPEAALEDAVSTLLCVDLSASDLDTSGLDSLLHYEPVAFDQTAASEAGGFQAGNELPIQWGGNFAIAMGRRRFCASGDPPPPVRDEPEIDDDGLLVQDYLFELPLTCSTGEDFMTVRLGAGSKLVFTIAEDQNRGFNPERSTFFDGGEARGEARGFNPFELDGQLLYRGLELIWTSAPKNLQEQNLNARISMRCPLTAVTGDRDLSWFLTLVDRADVNDEPPFNKPGQERHCMGEPLEAGRGTWHFTSLAKPYSTGRLLPHLTRPNGGFVSRLLLSNPTSETKTYLLLGYQAEGAEPIAAQGELAPGTVEVHSPTTVFLNDSVAWLVIGGDPQVQVAMSYLADRENAGPAHVSETRERASRWRVYSGNPSVTWDGLALINTGLEPTDIVLFQKDSDGHILETELLHANLMSGEKALFVLPALENWDAVFFEVAADQPLGLLALRGNLDSTFLWQNAAIPLSK